MGALSAVTYSSLSDSWWLKSASSWATARGDITTSAGFGSSTTTTNAQGVYSRGLTARGATTYYIVRSFFSFNLTRFQGNAHGSEVDSATLSIWMDNIGTADQEAVAIQASGLNGDSRDFGNIFETGSTLYSLLTNSRGVSSTGAYHDFNFTSHGIGVLKEYVGSEDPLTVGLISSEFDWANSAPSVGGDYDRMTVRYSNYSFTGSDPKLTINYKSHNPIFFGCNF